MLKKLSLEGSKLLGRGFWGVASWRPLSRSEVLLPLKSGHEEITEILAHIIKDGFRSRTLHAGYTHHVTRYPNH